MDRVLEYPSDTPGKENGYIYALPTPELTVGQIVRQAIVQEILTKGQANAFDSNMNRIITEAPTYQTYGRCLYPHPVEHNHEFPFIDGLDCLKSELKDIVTNITSEVSSENNSQSLSVYPNPFYNIITIKINVPNTESNPILLIRDFFGNILLTRNLQNGLNTINITNSELGFKRLTKCYYIANNEIKSSKTLLCHSQQ